MVTIETIRAAARHGDWDLRVTERVLRMAQLLDACASHPRLRDVLALKGGTALNMLDHDLPRLSVDLDFNVVGDWSTAELDAVRESVASALRSVAHRLALNAREVQSAHAGSAWRMSYLGVTGSGIVEVDLNFLFRVPLLTPRRVSATVMGALQLREVLAIAPAELAAGKLCALLDRTHPRDVWDAALIARAGGFSDPLLRRCFIAYVASARRPWRELLAQPIQLDPGEAERLVVPMLRGDERPVNLDSWCAELTDQAERAIAPLREPTADEAAFLDATGERGDVTPALLGLAPEDPMHAAIMASPALHWKAQHVRGTIDHATERRQ